MGECRDPDADETILNMSGLTSLVGSSENGYLFAMQQKAYKFLLCEPLLAFKMKLCLELVLDRISQDYFVDA